MDDVSNEDNYPTRADLHAEIDRLRAQVAAATSPVPGLADSGPYTLADVEAIEKHRGKPYSRLRETVQQLAAATADAARAELRGPAEEAEGGAAVTIDHEKAALIASGYGTTYTSPSDEAVKLVFEAYLALRAGLAEPSSAGRRVVPHE